MVTAPGAGEWKGGNILVNYQRDGKVQRNFLGFHFCFGNLYGNIWDHKYIIIMASRSLARVCSFELTRALETDVSLCSPCAGNFRNAKRTHI